MAKHWCKSYRPKSGANGNCGDCYNYKMDKGNCPEYNASTDLAHPPVKSHDKKSSRVTGVLR